MNCYEMFDIIIMENYAICKETARICDNEVNWVYAEIEVKFEHLQKFSLFTTKKLKNHKMVES